MRRVVITGVERAAAGYGYSLERTAPADLDTGRTPQEECAMRTTSKPPGLVVLQTAGKARGAQIAAVVMTWHPEDPPTGWTAHRNRWEIVHLTRAATALIGLAGTLATTMSRSERSG
jgi:hypothetical protein